MDQIVPFDLQRMLFGDAPPLFLLEICLRVAVIWLWTVLLLRWVGGRSISQLSVVEFLLVIALGSAVGDPMFQPDVPLLHAMLVILLVVSADKMIDLAFRKSSRVKRFVDGLPSQIMRDGHLIIGGLSSRGLGPTEAMEMLRLKDIRNLGEVDCAFLEPSGEVSIFRFPTPRPGLRIVPPVELRDPASPSAGNRACCSNCGWVQLAPPARCPECGAAAWTVAED